ncbi:MAG: MOSC domain-containing protein [Anaerolineae bacterium]|jgi:MOSC domain-containing protein YiiM|nr:MOSC domain-containing protein [Anaerolineae bacterium]
MELKSIVYKPKGQKNQKDHYLRVPLQVARLMTGHGIEGDAKGGHPKRQLNILSAETITALAAEGYQIAPGQLGEQLVISGITVENLAKGTILQIGESAQIEILALREGCDRFESIQHQTTHEGRLGMMARVITDGTIAIGDPVVIMPQPISV